MSANIGLQSPKKKLSTEIGHSQVYQLSFTNPFFHLPSISIHRVQTIVQALGDTCRRQVKQHPYSPSLLSLLRKVSGILRPCGKKRSHL
jgi:hypothetical protein